MNNAVLRTLEDIDWITIILGCSVLFLVIAKQLFYSRFTNFMILPFNNKYIFMYNKKEKLLHWFTILLSIFQILNFALFIYLLSDIFPSRSSSQVPYLFYSIIGFLLIFFISKVLLQLANGLIFNISDIISEYLFKKISYLNYSGLVMFMANILLTYVLKDSKAVVYVSGFLILLINTIGLVIVLRNHQKLIANNFFYFILYLCTLEITPLVLIGDYFKD
ncbi:DUF4271 domain-containing protein [Cellulophaga sp. Hel_I_12]|uniref:DUF4271 domain-containing protein n=1 Tax=Cellulophaga sp. Hel_I_12 TaxID=1249972 RepID=UPI000647E537|nr:DUF4271 domain-containing protein [Cellulophaga sp. Hel_I_12]